MTTQVMRSRTRSYPRSGQRVAVVLGGVDLLQPLVRAGVPCVVVSGADEPVRHSRHAREWIRWEPADSEELLVARLFEWAQRSGQGATLFYEHDEHLLAISRHAAELSSSFSFACAEPGLIEQLVDKSRFAQLAQRLDLPVPTTLVCDPRRPAPDRGGPWIVKPLRRTAAWSRLEPSGKAVECRDSETLGKLWPRLHALGEPVIVQELVEGPESRIESYHTYVRPNGAVAGEFTGVKVRTWPRSYGYTTALEVRPRADVVALGRAIVTKLGLTGVAKLDFKRRRDGDLVLLEVNPRFNLWHNAGAAAGCNLPALVWSDLTGQRLPIAGATHAVRWCDPLRDLRAARAGGVGWAEWLRWLRSCEVHSTFVARDPMPGAALAGLSVRRRLVRPGRSAGAEP